MGSQRNRCNGRMTSCCSPRLPSCLTPETVFAKMSSAEMPPNHRLLSSQSCKGSQIGRRMQTGFTVIHERESLASALLHKQNPCTLECQLPSARPVRRPVLDGQIGINLGEDGGGGRRGDTVTFHRGRKLWERRTGLSVLPVVPLAVSGQKPDTEQENFLPNLLLGCIIHRSHLMEMPSCGAAVARGVTECRSDSRAGARVSLTL